MNFKFNTRERYLTKSEQDHLDEFFRDEPQCKQIYKNPDGEKRLPLIVRRPRGCIAPDTVWGPTGEGGEKWYHTPCATLNGSVAVIHYRNPDTGETGNCTSVEWLKWLGGQWTSSDKPKPTPTAMDKFVENQQKAIEDGNIRSVSAEEFDRYKGGDDPDWQKAVKKSSQDTSQTKSSAKRSRKSSTKK